MFVKAECILIGTFSSVTKGTSTDFSLLAKVAQGFLDFGFLWNSNIIEVKKQIDYFISLGDVSDCETTTQWFPALHETCKSDGRVSASRAPTETLLRLSLLLDASCWPKALLPSCRLQLNQSVRESGPFGRTYHRLLSLFYVGHPADFLFQRFKTPSLINKCCMFISETMMVLAQLDTLPAPHPFCIPAAAAASSQSLFKTKQRS